MPEDNNNQINNQIPQPQQAPTTLTGQCINQSCNTPLSLPFPPIIHSHHPTMDALIIPHTKGITCPKCGAFYSIHLHSYQVALILAPDEKPVLNEDRLIEPASNLIPFHGMT